MNGTRRHLNRSYGTRQKAPEWVPFVLAGIALMRPGLCRAQALVRIPAASRRELAHERRGEESRSEAELPGERKIFSPLFSTLKFFKIL